MALSDNTSFSITTLFNLCIGAQNSQKTSEIVWAPSELLLAIIIINVIIRLVVVGWSSIASLDHELNNSLLKPMTYRETMHGRKYE